MHFVSATDGFRGSFGQPEVANFAGAHEFRHGADSFFDGNIGIDAMLVVEVDHIDAEALQAGIASSAYVRGAALYAAHDAEFCGEEDSVADAANGLANEVSLSP